MGGFTVRHTKPHEIIFMSQEWQDAKFREDIKCRDGIYRHPVVSVTPACFSLFDAPSNLIISLETVLYTVDCEWTYTPFSECSTSCGDGTHQRLPIILQPPQSGGWECPSHKMDPDCWGWSMIGNLSILPSPQEVEHSEYGVNVHSQSTVETIKKSQIIRMDQSTEMEGIKQQNSQIIVEIHHPYNIAHEV